MLYEYMIMCSLDLATNDVAKVFKALSDPTRIRILRLLRGRDLCVCELMSVLGMEQSRISHQMRVLREAGLVADRRNGRWMIYRIPGRSRALVERVLGGGIGDRLDKVPQVREDARKLELCRRENLRAKACGPGA
jgi:DNA-binding transcriptional ArsR family regulator